jgi:hypothetical protein
MYEQSIPEIMNSLRPGVYKIQSPVPGMFIGCKDSPILQGTPVLATADDSHASGHYSALVCILIGFYSL